MKIDGHHEGLNEQLKFFRDDDTSADSHGVVASPWSKETIDKHKKEERERITREMGSPDDLCQIIVEVVDELNGIKLAEQFRDDRKQQLLLKKKIDQAKSMIEDAGHLTKRYVQSIEEWQAAKDGENRQSDEKHLQKFTDAEIARKNSHNALISQLRALIRFVSFNFSRDVSMEALEGWQEDQLERGQEVLQAKRIRFSRRNIILPDSVNIRNRKHITAWAGQISHSLTKIEKLLSRKPESSSNH